MLRRGTLSTNGSCRRLAPFLARTRGGNVVIVEHSGGYATVYAHNQENVVRAGDRVRQGDTVARLGNSGRTSGPNLHFEVRKDNIARNPIYFLPAGQTAARQTAQRAKDDAT